MGAILLKTGTQTRQILLLESNGFGRSPELGAGSIEHTQIPFFWIEIRWLNSMWVWRVLNSDDKTTGKGEIVYFGWRKFEGTIRLQQFCEIELIDNRPPEVLIENVNSKQRLSASMCTWLCVGDNGYSLGEQEPILQHGQCFVVENVVYRIWLLQSYAPSRESICSISSPTCRLEIRRASLEAVFKDKDVSVIVQGEFVRVLLVYAIDRMETDGWLCAQNAYDEWVNLGGNAQSEPLRISWERNKLRALLLQHGVTEVDRLFDRQRIGATWFHRLCFPAEKITLVDA